MRSISSKDPSSQRDVSNEEISPSFLSRAGDILQIREVGPGKGEEGLVMIYHS